MSDNAIDRVMTSAEIVARYGLNHSTVRKAIKDNPELLEKGIVRQAGKVWLVDAEWARKRWGQS